MMPTLLTFVLAGLALASPLPPLGACEAGGGNSPPSGSLRAAPETLAQARRHPDRSVRLAMYLHVQEAAEARVAEDDGDLEARWWRVAAMGLRVDDESPRQKVVLAGAIRREADEILARDPDHPGGHHALGRLHSGVLRLNPVLRFFALRVFGEADLANAEWADAEHHMELARAAVPCALIHRFELSRSYAYQGKLQEALAELDALLALPDRAPQDPQVRELAGELRADVRDRMR
ncbi:hypothetical protein BH23GEM11_BH23GEM11_02930 [soil metagenome]